MNHKELSEFFFGKDAPFRCPKCDTVWPDNAKFCGYCGTRLVDNNSEKQAESEE